MALCEKFSELSRLEQIEMVGKVIHALQNDSICFDKICQILNYAERVGILDNVIINPPATSAIEEDELSHV